MLSHVSGSGGPAEGCAARLLISGPMSTMTSFRTRSGRFDVKYIAVPAAHGEPDERRSGGQAELIHHARDVVEGCDGVVDLGGIAVAVAALVHRVDVEVGLERDAERVPGVRVPGEAVQEEERRAAAAAPVQDVEPQAVDDHVAIDRTKEIHGGAHDSRIGGRSPSLDAVPPPEEDRARFASVGHPELRKGERRWISAVIFQRRDRWPPARRW